MENSFKNKTISGLIWTFLDNFVVKGISFATNIFLAKLLSPEDFGLIGMVTIFIAIANTLIDAGLTSSLIRSQDIDNSDYSTVFITNIISSIILYVLLFACAPWIASFYNIPILIDILRMYGLIFILSSLYAVQITILIKRLDFKKITIYNIPGVVMGSTVGVMGGYYGYGVWSLVYSYLSIQIVNILIFWTLCDWKPSLVFSRKKFKKHFDFGYKLLLTGILGNIFNNIYNIVIGKFFPLRSLGFFDRANTFSQYPSTVLIMMIGKVSFPILAEYQNDVNQLKIKFKKFITYSIFVISFIMISISFWGDIFFIKILGKDWSVASTYFSIFCYAGIFLPLHSLNTNTLKIMGRTDLILKMEIIMKIVISIIVFIAYFKGIQALVISFLINAVILFLLNIYYSAKVIPYSFFEQLIDVTKILCLSLSLFASYYFFRMIIPNMNLSYSYMLLLTFFNLILFLFVAKLLRFTQTDDLFDIVKSKMIKK
ncbi:lipopolysaccharide biosynthesis protein [Sphingobacterium spiritivorum]|uniref:Polysaccharide biosynthesis protein n=1 Tax=Sphingobacterium spiritivorum ATCC 33861 TaxID=525373 RepID=D7VI82_SPHSI|nr:lipopolysaccharide biosynthesis protein [Sphingobacterium spiritivorum]EFK59784.1 polysaccharide biosynthesis protein [Sphingobacterium spiritivorum ATCC 33861]QQT37571.1 lipopolysaccharide biosynthesis protein [Sphingobacterium spiritivorum]WQD34368.1 lipopolysaccharide biosynthesis protein [Sphingobacterium spiritivorum]SUI97300.1 Lipopolysaccharide biosynthesis protein wzxC [Sphingobacterium spiritivorum]